MEAKVKGSKVGGTVQAPSSKSYAQRAIAAALLAKGETVLQNMELCSDTRAALLVARALGATSKHLDESTYAIAGGGRPASDTIDIGESGLSTRMFTPIASLSDRPITITGHGSILKRPMEMMAGPLVSLGVKVTSRGGYLPMTVHGPLLGGEAEVDGSVSSQFLTGLLMALPLAQNDTTLYVGRLNSIPYINMTVDVLCSFGIEVGHNDDFSEFFIEGRQKYTPRTYNIEGDWSGASCLLVAGAVAGEITITNLNPLSLQADVEIVEALSRAGAEIITENNRITVKKHPLQAFDFDATHCPDLFPALVALAANCDGVSVLKGTERLTHKESDRAETLRDEFGKMGIKIDISQANTMKVTGGTVRSAVVNSRNDHRIAMATAVAALAAEGETVIEDAEAVNKSYPDFWRDLGSVTGA